MVFAVIGGDARLAYLRPMLLDDGHATREFALRNAEDIPGSFRVGSVKEVAAEVDCVILPLPLVGSDGSLNTPLDDAAVALKDVWSSVKPGTLICGGYISEIDMELARSFGHEPQDYYKREEVIVSNAVATAEGACRSFCRKRPLRFGSHGC